VLHLLCSTVGKDYTWCMEAIIIGSGISGLTAGALLARNGVHVRVLEQYGEIGGVTAGMEKDGFRWDMGQLVLEGFGPGDPTGLILEETGVAREIELIAADRVYQFPDFRIEPQKEFAGNDWRKKLLKEMFPADAAGIDRYYRLYRRMMEIFTLGRRSERASTFLGSKWNMLRLYLKLLPLLPIAKRNAESLLSEYFREPKLRAVFLSILADFVTPPSQFPGLGVPSVNPEPAFDKRVSTNVSRLGRQPGYHFIRGGTRSLVNALVRKIQSNGGEIQTGVFVNKILLESAKASGVLLADGTKIAADLVIATAGAKETFAGMIGKENLPPEFIKKVNDVPLMESIFMVQLGVDYDPLPAMGHPLVYYYRTYEIEESIARLKSGKYHEGRDGFVLCVPTAASPEMAPEGCHSVTLYTVAPDRMERGSYTEMREALADRLIEEAQKDVPGLAAHTRVRVIVTPDDFRRRIAVDHHSFGGLAPLMGTSGVPHRTPIKGFYYAGAMSESGAGMNNVIAGAWRVFRMIGKDTSSFQRSIS